MNETFAKRGLIAAGAMNVGGVLLFSRGFTNPAIPAADPVVMSNFGLLMIMIWELAYWAATSVIPRIKWIAGVFAIEKLIYGVVWIAWLMQNDLATLYATDRFAGVFFTIYGLNDLGFMVFFGWLFFAKSR